MSSPGTRVRSTTPTSGSRQLASDEARLEHIATECIAKAVNIVLASRLSSLQRGKQPAQAQVKDNRNRWFNLETEEVDCAISSLDVWKRDTSLTLVAEIFGEKAGADSSFDSSDSQEGAHLLEAWTFQVQRKDFNVGGSGSGTNSASSSATSSSSAHSSSSQTRLTRVHSQRLDTPVIYKRAVIFLRSLYCFVRLLPAFSVYQVTKRSSSSKLRLTSKIRIGHPSLHSDYGPDVSFHKFKQIETPVGNICTQVAYVNNPVEALAREYGNSVMYSAPKEMEKNKAVPIAVKPNRGSPGGMMSSQGFSPHSAPQVIRRQSWSFSRTQMQLEASNARSKFSDVMVVDPVEECEEKQPRHRQNSSPMLIPNAHRKSPNTSNVSSAVNSGGSSNLSSQLRVKMSISPGTNSMKARTAPGRSSSLTAKVYRTVSGSPDECVVGFAMRKDKFSEDQLPNNIAKMELPISALNQRKLESTSAVGLSIVKTPSSSVKSGDGSEMSGYRMPLSCSPQLPFAMTPKWNSGSSLSYDFQASPMNSGSGIPSIRLVRRASPKDSSEMTSFNSSSCSPGQDNFLESGLPYPPLYYGSYNKPRITFPSSFSGTYEEEDQDALPFAFEAQNSPGERSAIGREEESQDAAIGAFVRTLQEAPPLRNASPPTPTCRTLSSAMLELKQLRETLDTARLVSN